MCRDWPTELWELFIEIEDVKEANIVEELQEWIIGQEKEVKQLQTEEVEIRKQTDNHAVKQQRKIDKLETKLEKLKEFARFVIKVECWSIYDQDGGDLQELAEKLGLIEPHIATEEDLRVFEDYEVGDKIYKFSDILKGEVK